MIGWIEIGSDKAQNFCSIAKSAAPDLCIDEEVKNASASFYIFIFNKRVDFKWSRELISDLGHKLL